MKKTLIILFALTLSSIVIGQNISFDDSMTSSFITIDTLNNSANSWHVGEPQKSLFDSAYSPPFAILTDTINNYPINDSSSFYLWYTDHYPGWWPNIRFQFKIDSDSLNDFGIIEVSPDQGQTWINPLLETQAYNFEWYVSYSQVDWLPNDSILFTGTTDSWKTLNLTLFGWDEHFVSNDSILFRFSFFSDSIETNQNGWVIDDIHMFDFFSSVKEVTVTLQSQVYPNPVTDNITIKLQNANVRSIELTITDEKGQIVLRKSKINETEIKLNITGFKSGIYFYHLKGEGSDKQGRGSFVKN